jgi:serine/threonine-protein kinase
MSGTDGVPPAFGRYQQLSELGTGAMGKVYLAEDPRIGRRVAVKVISAHGLSEEERAEFLDRFRAEVRAAALCAHPAIVAVHDFADEDPVPYLVMEYVPGNPLSALLRRPAEERAASAPALAAAMLQVIDGLGAAHAAGVIHRDIKPSNIMITPLGAAKITDFGIARLPSSTLTMFGAMIGTPSYMSPEQAQGDTVDHRTDLFAAAVVLFEILRGRPPFAGATMAETLLRLTGPAEPDLGPLAGTAMGDVLARGLAKPREARFASAEAFSAALRQALAENPLSGAEATLVMDRGPGPAPYLRPPSPISAASRNTGSEGSGARFALPPGTGARASEALAFNLGPIARVLVEKAASRATTPDQFVQILCEHVPPEEQGALRRKLSALL